ncbi:TetR/AcrR family transcriptional regulator [candidate division KSB1 bacterium]
MVKTDGKKTKEKILRVAEELFSKKGFDGTSVDRIAKTARVNKALIYYHFKDKNDIITSLFKSMVEEASEYIECSYASENRDLDVREQIREEIGFLLKRKNIVSVMIMESLKGNDKGNYFFKFAEIVINDKLNREIKALEGKNKGDYTKNERYYIYEFFTGIVPIIMFAAFRDKWCEYFNDDKKKLMENFIDLFNRSHIEPHVNPINPEKG